MQIEPKQFFSHYMFHPGEDELSSSQKCQMLVATIALGILTLGFAHLVCLIAYRNISYRSWTKSPNDPVNQVAQSAFEKLNNSGLTGEKLVEQLKVVDADALTDAEGMQLTEKAANTGSLLAMEILGNLDGFGRRTEEQLNWLKKAAEAGSLKAMEFLGTHYSLEEPERLPWLQKAAEKGSQKACQKLIDYYSLGFKKDLVAAEKWLRYAGQRGLLVKVEKLDESELELKNSAEVEAYLKERNKIWTIEEIKQANLTGTELYNLTRLEHLKLHQDEINLLAAQKGHPGAMLCLGQNLTWQESTRVEGIEWLKKAADAGEKLALQPLINNLLKLNEKTEAAKWLREAIKQKWPITVEINYERKTLATSEEVEAYITKYLSH